MSGFLLDTNCISEVVRIRPEPAVVRWLGEADEQTLFLSVLASRKKSGDEDIGYCYSDDSFREQVFNNYGAKK